MVVAEEFAVPFTSATPFCMVGVPVQLVLLNKLKLTVPVGVVELVLDAISTLSCTLVPIVAEVVVALLAFSTVLVSAGPVSACAISVTAPATIIEAAMIAATSPGETRGKVNTRVFILF